MTIETVTQDLIESGIPVVTIVCVCKKCHGLGWNKMAAADYARLVVESNTNLSSNKEMGKLNHAIIQAVA